MNIEIITTKNDELKETGFGSIPSCLSVMNALDDCHHTRLTRCSTHIDLNEVVLRQPDLVILAAKYMPVKGKGDVWFSEYFSNNHIVYSGSDRETLKFDSDKVSAKNHLRKLGVKTANYFTATPGQYKSENELPLKFPLFVKPTDAANGNGIDDTSLVNSFVDYEKKVTSLFKTYKSAALVEQYLSGKEYTVAIIRKSNGDLMASAIEIEPPISGDGLRILSAEVKKADIEYLKAINEIDLDNVTSLAIDAFKHLGISEFGRIDIKMDDEGECYFMEANMVPGMTLESSYFPMAFEIANNINYDEVISMMFEDCIDRANSHGKYANSLTNESNMKKVV